MSSQLQLTQELVDNMVFRVRNLMEAVSSLDPRLKIMIHLYRQFQITGSPATFEMLVKSIEDAEYKIFDSREQESEQNQDQDQDQDDP